MHVSSLQEFLRSLIQPLAALGLNKSSENNVSLRLTELSEAFAPFREMTVEQLSDLLRVADEYRRTGRIPDWVAAKKPSPTRARAPKAPKPPKPTTAEAVAHLRDLMERSPDLPPEKISEEVQALNALSANEVKEVQKEFLGAVLGKSKKDQLAELEKRIHQHRERRDRSQQILAY